MRRRSRILLVGLFIAVAGSAAPANALVDQLISWVRNFYSSSKTHVVVIGINEYSRARSLDYAVNDAEAMIGLFEALGYDVGPRLLRAEPSSANHITRDLIRTTVRRVLQTAKAQDRVIVFYAGHGKEVLDRFDPNLKEAYLLPSDYDPGDVTGTGLAFKDLVRLAREPGVEAKHILFILDACYAAAALDLQSGREEPVKADDPYIRHLVSSPGVVAITAGDKGQPVREAGGHGVFTNLLIRGLAGDADTDVNGLVHFEELAGWLKPLVFKRSGSFKQVVKNGKLAPGAGEPVFVVPSDDVRRKILGALVADEVKANLIKRCNTERSGRDCPYLARAPEPVLGPAPVPDQVPEDERVWRVIQNSTNPRDFEFFLNKYPDSLFAPFARNRLEETRREPAPKPRVPSPETQVAVVEPQVAVGVFPEKLKPGATFRDCPACPEMVVVPAGSFLMGSPESEDGRSADEGPQHPVRIGEPFAVGKYEVTFDQWDACVAGGGCNGHRPDDHGWGRGRRPVIDVSWDDAKAYVGWLSGKTGEAYRLLSEAEWEYVARAGTSTPFSTGSTISPDQANYDGNYASGSGRQGIYRERTNPVGSFSSNAFGLYDVHGNVWEWTEDCGHDGYRGAPGNGGAWTTGGECDNRVLRGGSWGNWPRNLRSANRGRNSADVRGSGLGFRVARTLTTDEIAQSLETQSAALAPAPAASIEVVEMDATFVALKTSNVRAEPTVESERIGRLSRDDSVAVTGKVKGKSWYRIDYQGRTAFVFDRLIIEIDAGEPAAWEKVVGSSDRADVENFLRGYPTGHFAERAKALLAALVPPPEKLKPGATFRECPTCPEMVVVPAGSFLMGSPITEKDRRENEGPQHRVTFPRPFAVGKYEVTFGEWDACVAEAGCQGYRPSDQGWGRDRRPAIGVNWEDAQAYAQWLSDKTGKPYRLLTEAEWEYAARAETTTRFWWGNNVGLSIANCSYCGSRWDGKQTAPVGSFRPNDFGLYDTAGNARELVQDKWHKNYNGAPEDGSAWMTGGRFGHVLRGGSWLQSPNDLRSAERKWYVSTDRGNLFGFRVARTLP